LLTHSKNCFKRIKDKPWHVEGSDNAEWVLMDYVNVVVHVFQTQIREYYNIENLWEMQNHCNSKQILKKEKEEWLKITTRRLINLK
jgi:ribosomal silencing factor RsfS